jgi:hypothetical protein
MVGSVPFAFGKCLFELSNFPREKEEREERKKNRTINSTIYIFRFRSYLVTDIGRILDAKGGFVNFLEA